MHHQKSGSVSPAARTGSPPTFASEPETKAHAQFGQRHCLVNAHVEGESPDCAHTQNSVRNTTTFIQTVKVCVVSDDIDPMLATEIDSSD